MQYRSLGRSPFKLSEIGFGCMSLSPDESESTRLIHRAMDLGINFFDTADLYQAGNNERMLGNALKEKRKDIILATKVGNQWRNDGSGWDWNPRKEYILSAVDKSLDRLQTDYIDLYQLHGGMLDDPVDETIGAFEMLIHQGKILRYGISSIRPNMIREFVDRSHLVSVMMQYSLLDRRPEESCLPLLQSKGISVLARGSLAKGLLAGKPADPFLNYSKEEVKKIADAIQAFSGTRRSDAQTALRWVLQQSSVTSCVVGIRTMQQLEDVAAATDAPPLSAAELKTLSGILPVNMYKEHR
ncbi:MAG TPA: aldo/keto reductase [Puia sp.]|nr:aldo/keto reductase [Puia sp.]